MRGFRRLVWSESAKCGSWRRGGVSKICFVRSTLSKYPSPKLNAIQSRCLLSVLPNVIEEAVWMSGVVVG